MRPNDRTPGGEDSDTDQARSPQDLEFCYSIGSTYTYLTVMRIGSVTQSRALGVRWRPFNVREIMKDIDNIPFIGKRAKPAYVWRDLERRTNLYGLPIDLPVEYPIGAFELINRIAVLSEIDGWSPDFVTAVYRQWFQGGWPPGSNPGLMQTLDEIGQSATRVLQIATCRDIAIALSRSTLNAMRLGIFGSPSFIVGNCELFWGDDWLEDAVDYCQQT